LRILTLGAGGFIGSHLTRRLLGGGHFVTAVDIHSEKIKDCLQYPAFTYIKLDISNSKKKLRELIGRSDIVIDLIAHANPGIYVKKPLEVFQLNFIENLKIAELCVEEKKRLIQFSSCEVYGKTAASCIPEELKDPESSKLALFSEDTSPYILGTVNQHRWIYSCGKQLLERVLHAYGLEDRLNYTIIRPFNFIGPEIDFLPSEGDGMPRVFSFFMDALINSTPMLVVNGGKQKRCYTFIDDAIECIVRIVENKNKVCNKEIFNIGSPANEVSIRDLALLMREIYVEDFGAQRNTLPQVVEISGEGFYGPGYDDSDRRIPDISKSQSLLNWHPHHDIRKTLKLTMRYYLERNRQEL